MLGTRTKQVFSYGKRNQRIVNISDPNDLVKNAPSIFDDDPPTRWAPVISKMRKRENVTSIKSKTPSPRAVSVKKRKDILTPPRTKRARVHQIIGKDKPNESHSKRKSTAVTKVADISTPPRHPLGVYPVNLPGSPAVPGVMRKKPRMAYTTGTPSGLQKPFSPFVDVDIIVLDDSGRKLSQERRVSRTDIQVNLTNETLDHQVIDLVTTDSEIDNDIASQPKPSKRSSRRARPILYSDESESEYNEPPKVKARPLQASAQTQLPVATQVSALGLATKTSTLKVEVLIPRLEVKRSPRPGKDDKASRSTAISTSPPIKKYSQLAGYHYVSSPIARPRQLTPMRARGKRHPFEPPSPPSPTTPTDLDLSVSLDISELNFSLGLSPSHRFAEQPQTPLPPPYLLPLLAECSQDTCGPHEFSAFIESFPYDPIVRSEQGTSSAACSHVCFKKIGEASYSEVFGIGGVVLKIIPLRDEELTSNRSRNSTTSRWAGEEDGPAPSDAKDVLKEIIVTRAMGEVCSGFVKLLRTYVVRGRYPEVLLGLWDEYLEKKGSESVRPDTFNVSQTYAIIVLPNGGSDLEAYTFTNAGKMGWRQACSLFWQVAKALAQAEELVSFEHRDLHWGQILIKNTPMALVPILKPSESQNRPKPKVGNKIFMDDPTHGVRATVIDLGLSRMDAGDGQDGVKVHWTPFDEEVFMGEGDYQFDIYRMIREHNGDSWEEFRPMTNVMWLHYLTTKLLNSKRLKPPAAVRKGVSTSLQSTKTNIFNERECHNCLVEMEKLLGECVGAIAKVKSKSTSRRKTKAPEIKVAPSGLVSAAEVVGFGEKMGWVKSDVWT